jgi:predicted ester cyclase
LPYVCSTREEREELARGARPAYQGRSTGIVSTPDLVRLFYERIWNNGDLDAIPALLAKDFKFRGSLGTELSNQKEFRNYVLLIRGAITNYHCEILCCVAEDNRAFAKVRFGGIHTGRFRGFKPTGLPVSWVGAALFRFTRGLISELWVLGDLVTLDESLRSNASV